MDTAVNMASQAAHMANEAAILASQQAATWVDVYFGPFWENKVKKKKIRWAWRVMFQSGLSALFVVRLFPTTDMVQCGFLVLNR